MKTIVVPAKMPCSCTPSGGDRKHCCCGGSSGGSGGGSGTGTTIHPALIENGSETWTPSPSYAGTSRSSAFQPSFLEAALGLRRRNIGSYRKLLRKTIRWFPVQLVPQALARRLIPQCIVAPAYRLKLRQMVASLALCMAPLVFSSYLPPHPTKRTSSTAGRRRPPDTSKSARLPLWAI
jgi:hypothetical protein